MARQLINLHVWIWFEFATTNVIMTNNIFNTLSLDMLKIVFSFLCSNDSDPLHWASMEGELWVIRVLVKAGTNVNVKDYIGWTPLFNADRHNYTEVAAFLRSKGATKWGVSIESKSW